MAKTVIFGGTTEGRLAALQERDAVICVASAYAAALLPPDMDCRVGRLDLDRMRLLLSSLHPERVLDATHPYAVTVSANIRTCCQELSIPYVRVERPSFSGPWRDHVVSARDAEDAARLLVKTSGPILLTTGSQTLSPYTRLISPDRLWVRVLPTVDALERCESAGLPASHIIAMQGPFSEDFNAALFDMLHIAVLVTKDSGNVGGLMEKVLPALAREIDVILIERP